MKQFGAAGLGDESSCQASDESSSSEGEVSDENSDDQITKIENIGFNPEVNNFLILVPRRYPTPIATLPLFLSVCLSLL